jgi:Baseplate J-like protein
VAVSTNTFSTFVSNSAAAIQGAASQLLDLTVGSVLRAFVDAYSLLALWLQAVALQVAALTRLATSNGPDVDSFLADFGDAREQGTFASGPVTFARFTPTAQATIQAATQSGTTAAPVFTGGTVIQTQTGVQYQVIPDTTQSAFNVSLNAYVIPAGTASITATVQALVSGSAGNAGEGLIDVLSSAVPGVDTVTNAAPFQNGTDPETDAEARAGFPLFLQSLSRATPTAIEAAIQALGENVDFTLTENETLAGVAQPGFFFVVADNGTGNPPSGFLASVGSAIEAVRGASITFAVFGPTIVTANVVMQIATSASVVHATAVAQVTAALQAFIDALPIGASLPFTILSSIAYGVSGVTNVTGVTLNGGTADIDPTAAQIIKAGTISVS